MKDRCLTKLAGLALRSTRASTTCFLRETCQFTTRFEPNGRSQHLGLLMVQP